MPSTSGPTDIANLALSLIGQPNINSITDQTSVSAIACNTNFWQSIQEVSRGAAWNCLRKSASLVQTVNPTVTSSNCPAQAPFIPWSPFTAYAANVNLSFGTGLYTTAFAYTSGFSFTIDLTSGALLQVDIYNPNPFGTSLSGGAVPISGWNYVYLLPSDFILMVAINDYWCWGSRTEMFEVAGNTLLTNECQAIIKYTGYVTDTTQYDPLFVDALTCLLASKIATTLRKDDARMSQELVMRYKDALSEARARNAGERKLKRFNLISDSRTLRSRYYGTNG